MSSPTTPRAPPPKPVSTSPSSKTPIPCFKYSRLADADFGDLLARARSFEPTQVPLPLPSLSFSANSEGGVRLPSTGLGSQESIGGLGIAEGAFPRTSFGKRASPMLSIGTGKTSYRSPYKYPSGEVVESRAVFNDDMLFNQPKSIRSDAFKVALTNEVPDVQKESVSVALKPDVKAPAGAIQRTVLLGPLRMVRSQCANSEILAPVLKFLDSAMPVELQTPVVYDPILPEVVYSVSIPMTDEDWADYQKVLAVFPRVAAFNGMLSTGDTAFDQVTATHPTAGILSQGSELEGLLAVLVKRYNLGIPWDVCKPWDKPGQEDWKCPI